MRFSGEGVGEAKTEALIPGTQNKQCYQELCLSSSLKSCLGCGEGAGSLSPYSRFLVWISVEQVTS